MRILITGATGYLGSHLCQSLGKAGHTIFAAVRDTEAASKILQGPAIELVSLASDILETQVSALQEKIDVCIHAATRYGKAEETAEMVEEANYSLPVRLERLATRAGIETFLNIDTPIPAEVSQYARYKKQFRDYLQSESQVPRRINVTLQYFYGESEPQGRLVSSLIDAALTGQESFQLSPGEQKRDFIYMDDVLEFFTELFPIVEELDQGWIELEIGSGHGVSLKELVALIQELHPQSRTRFEFGAFPYRKNEPMQVIAKLEPNQRYVRWAPRTPLPQGLQKVIEYKREQERV